ncbi:MAG: hypothetical protein QMD13_09125 [Candidatus Bathyarchaeia archaeon]|nr:hypothetical protein [Candidatus Bathyarchaeia archaeon]
MDTEIYSFALKNALNEVRNICPDIKNSFMFRKDGEIIAGDEATPEKAMVRVANAFHGILEKAEAIGGVGGVTFEGSKGRANISCVNDLYLVTVTSRKADMKYVNTVTRVLIPTALRLLEKIHPAPLKSKQPQPEIPIVKESEEPKETLEPEIEPELPPLEPSANQLIVEDLGGLLLYARWSDTVRIDYETLSQWQETYNRKKIKKVEIETFEGKTMQYKVKPIKDSKRKGIIQMPEKILLDLEIKKGEPVRVKPVVE